MKWILSSTFGLIGMILVLIACPFLAVAAGAFYLPGYAIKDWPLAPAVVTGLSQSESYNSSTSTYSTTYCPFVEYTTTDGETIEVNLNECSSPPAYEVGDPVEVYYNPEDPQQAILKGGTLQIVGNIFAIVFGILGGVVCLVGGGLALFAIVTAAWPGRAKTPTSM